MPVHALFLADTGVLTDERYVLAACGYSLPMPDAVCPEVFAGESPFMVLYALVVVPVGLIRGGRRTMIGLAAVSLIFALVQLVAAFYSLLPSSLAPPGLNPDLLPTEFERDPATCGLVLCGLDHTLFHLVQVPLLIALSLFAYRGARHWSA